MGGKRDIMIKVQFTKMSFKFERILYLKKQSLKIFTTKAGRNTRRNGLIYNQSKTF